MNQKLENIYNEIKNDSLIRLADDAVTLADYVSRYFGNELTLEEANTLLNVIIFEHKLPPPLVKGVKKKTNSKKKNTKLVTA